METSEGKNMGTDIKYKSGRATKSNSPANRTAQSATADRLRELFLHTLKDMYWAEKTLTKTLPRMAKNATSTHLISTINDHLTETEEQVLRLEEVFDLIGEKANTKKCEAMEGLIKEADTIIKETQQGAVRDAGIIGACQKIEHYEIATYGTLAAFARTLDEDEALELLQLTLEEEKKADTLLTEVAYNNINFEATEEENE